MGEMKNPAAVRIGQRVAELRSKKGLTQEACSEAMHISRQKMAKIEAAHVGLSAEDAIRLADFFGVPCDYLLRGCMPENVSIINELGLSEPALHTLSNLHREHPTASRFFDCMLSEWPELEQFVHELEIGTADYPDVPLEDVRQVMAASACSGVYRLIERFIHREG